MIVSNGELVTANRALNELAEERLPVAGALRVRRLLREVRAHLEDVDAVIAQIVDRHGVRGEDGEIEQPSPGMVLLSDEGQAEYAALLAQEAEIEHGLRVSDLGSIDVKAATLLALGSLLEESE